MRRRSRKADVEPGGEQVLQLGVQRQQALVALQVRQQFGAQVDQEAHAFGEDGEALQQPRARRHDGAAQVDLRPAASSGVPCAASYCSRAALSFFGSGANCSLISSQQSRRCSGVALRVPAGHALARRPPSTSLTLRIDDGLQLGRACAAAPAATAPPAGGAAWPSGARGWSGRRRARAAAGRSAARLRFHAGRSGRCGDPVASSCMNLDFWLRANARAAPRAGA